MLEYQSFDNWIFFIIIYLVFRYLSVFRWILNVHWLTIQAFSWQLSQKDFTKSYVYVCVASYLSHEIKLLIGWTSLYQWKFILIYTLLSTIIFIRFIVMFPSWTCEILVWDVCQRNYDAFTQHSYHSLCVCVCDVCVVFDFECHSRRLHR